MTTYTVSNGYDTTASQGVPTGNFSDVTTVLTGVAFGNNLYGFVYMPLPADIVGTTVASATLTGHAANSVLAQTFNVYKVTSGWAAGTLTYNRMPTFTATPVATAVAAAAAGAAINLDVTSLVQTVASGGPWYGFRLATAGALTWKSFEYGANSSWVLTVVTTDAPEQPQALVPNGTVVGEGAPVLTCDFSDNGGLTNDMAAMQVQISTSTSFTSPVYDQTGTTTVPVFDLSSPPPGATAFTAVSSGTTRFWRVRVQDADGNFSAYSDPASFTFRTQPTLTLLTPASGIVYDPTTDIVASSSANLSAYRVQITDGTDRTAVRYDTGRVAANPAALTTIDVPLPQEYEGSRVLVDDADYQLHIQAWDTFTSRQSTPGSPAYVESWSTFHFDDDAGVVVPDTLTADQPDQGPSIVLTWTAAAAPDAWVVLRDGSVIARLDGTDVIVGTSTYSWADPHPQQWVNHEYVVKAIDGGHQGAPSPVADIVPGMTDLYLFTQDGDQVFISNPDTSQLTVGDRRASYKPINLNYDVDIVSGLEGVSGTVSGTVLTDDWQDAIDARTSLLTIRSRPSLWVRMVYGTFSGRVLLRNVSVLPHPGANPGNQAMSVSFGVNQVGDFDAVL